MKDTIGSPELRTMLSERSETFTLLDVRELEEYAYARIDGCTLIPLGELMVRAPKELDPKSEIIVYCAHGVRSMNAVMGLRSLGFENVRSLTGGISDYLGID